MACHIIKIYERTAFHCCVFCLLCYSWSVFCSRHENFCLNSHSRESRNCNSSTTTRMPPQKSRKSFQVSSSNTFSMPWNYLLEANSYAIDCLQIIFIVYWLSRRKRVFFFDSLVRCTGRNNDEGWVNAGNLWFVIVCRFWKSENENFGTLNSMSCGVFETLIIWHKRCR